MNKRYVLPPEVTRRLDDLDGSGSDCELASVRMLHGLLGNDLPRYLLQKYKLAKQCSVRGSCVHHATRYAKSSTDAIDLGRLALKDRSQMVRYGACTLLAYSLNKSALSDLYEILETTPENSKADMVAAIDAIENQNHNFFVDRTHSGNVTLNID